MEAALRSCYYLATGQNPDPDAFHGVRGMDGWKEAAIDINGTEVKVAVVSGLGNARKLIEAVRRGEVFYHFVEVMACPGGCIAGAGTVQPPEKSRRMLEQYEARAALDNPLDSEYMEDIELLYEDPENWDRVSRH